VAPAPAPAPAPASAAAPALSPPLLTLCLFVCLFVCVAGVFVLLFKPKVQENEKAVGIPVIKGFWVNGGKCLTPTPSLFFFHSQLSLQERKERDEREIERTPMESIVTCCVCNERMNDPIRTLPCLHSGCLQCLETYSLKKILQFSMKN